MSQPRTKASDSSAPCAGLAREPHDNGYARPIENIVAVVDLNRKHLVRVEDYGVIPLPPEPGNWAREYIKETRDDLKPLDVSQPEGPSFTVKAMR